MKLVKEVYKLSQISNGFNELYGEGKDISIENANMYTKLETNRFINISKYLMLSIYILVLTESVFNIIPCKITLSSLPKSWDQDIKFWQYILIGFLLNTFLSWIVHLIAYKNVTKRRKISFKGMRLTKKIKLLLYNSEINYINLKNNIGITKLIIYRLLSPDYFYAEFFKAKLHSEVGISYDMSEYRDKNRRGIMEWDSVKIQRKFFVEYSNWFNVMVIIAITLVMLTVWNFEGFVIDSIFYFLTFRLLSRTIEIVSAYYKDVVRVDSKIFKKIKKNQVKYIYVNNWKSSAIRKPARISLACYTLFEMILTFALLYYFLSLRLCEHELPIANLLYYWNFVAYSISVSIFNFSYTSYPLKLWSILHITQYIIGFVLIVLSLARYLGLSDDITERDEKFFIEVERLKSTS